MKKRTILFASLIFGCMAATTLESCQSDDEVTVSIDEDVLQSGIDAAMTDGIYTVNVRSNGDWTLAVASGCDWVSLLQTEGHGNEQVEVVVDANYTGADRSTTLSLTAGNETVNIRLQQTATLDGEAADNDADYLKLAGSKYLGFGCNLMEFFDDPKKNPIKYTSNNIVNCAAIEKLMQNDDFAEYSSLALTNPIDEIDYEAIKTDTIVDKKDELGISIDIQIAYGLMKFGLSGAYHGNETLGSQVLQIKTGANYPVLEASINYADIVAVYDTWVKDNSPQQDIRKNILTPGFTQKREELRQACAASTPDESKIKGIVQNILGTYGTGIVTQSKLGGLIALELDVDSMYIQETVNLDSAKVTADISAGLFSLKGEAKATYLNQATSHFQHARHKVKVLGGSKSELGNVVKLFEKATYGTQLSDAIIAWAESIDYDNTRSVSLIDVETRPIWDLFTDPASAAAIQKYLKERYPNSNFIKTYIE